MEIASPAKQMEKHAQLQVHQQLNAAQEPAAIVENVFHALMNVTLHHTPAVKALLSFSVNSKLITVMIRLAQPALTNVLQENVL